MASPLVSVIVPTFNRAYCLERTLRSALAQTHRSLEVIVVDDGSTDDTPALLQRLQREDGRIRTITQANQGVVVARNVALQRASGAYVAFLDSDDTWYPWKVELQLACFGRLHDLGMVWSDMTAVDPDGAIISGAFLREMYTAYRRVNLRELFALRIGLDEVAPSIADAAGGTLHIGRIFSTMLYGSLVHTSTVMLSRARLERVGLFDTAMGKTGEDYDFHLRTCREGPVGLVDVATIAYQTGLTDRLTRPELSAQIAEGYLKAVMKAVTRDRAEIDLADSEIAAIEADAHSWLGEELLEHRRPGEARAHLVQSLRQHVKARTVVTLLRTYLPEALAMPLRLGYHSMRGL
jgi:GT2 family glycosyltransferase